MGSADRDSYSAFSSAFGLLQVRRTFHVPSSRRHAVVRANTGGDKLAGVQLGVGVSQIDSCNRGFVVC